MKVAALPSARVIPSFNGTVATSDSLPGFGSAFFGFHPYTLPYQTELPPPDLAGSLRLT
jgi:hypothetical protein